MKLFYQQVPALRAFIYFGKMRDSVLWRKQSRIVMMLSKELNISAEQALDIYYSSDTARLLSDSKTGLQLMSDQYVLEDLLKELNNRKRA